MADNSKGDDSPPASSVIITADSITPSQGDDSPPASSVIITADSITPSQDDLITPGAYPAKTPSHSDLNEDQPTEIESTPIRPRRNLRKRAYTEELQTPTTSVQRGESDSDSDYFFTPKKIRTSDESINALCFLNAQQMSNLVQTINKFRSCSSPNCRGSLVTTSVQRSGLGGAATFTYNCNGCLGQEIVFNTCKLVDDKSEIDRALQVAFIVSGCTYTTYTKVLKQSLGIQTRNDKDFMGTIRQMYPIVKDMVDDVCRENQEEMKKMKSDEWGSWERAITVADGVWMTRGYHSKNFTFSIRNYKTDGLLYRIHLCQKGRDKEIQEELYQGSSKAAEGYAAKILFKKAKNDGMKVALNWQDDDSSTSKAIKEIFPEAQVMLCRGHSGRAHWKKLKEMKKMKQFPEAWTRLNQKYVSIPQNISCKCKRHNKNCGCMTQDFIDNARNLLSHIISNSKTSELCAQRIRSLYKHALNDHSGCDFHPLIVCTCKKCPDKENVTCNGAPYCSKFQLKCDFHKLAYKAEIEHRASEASKLIHDELQKAGHTHAMEASHNILIRYRPKHIALERLHYNVSTDLGLLQANLSVARKTKGEEYHWIPVLYQKMGIPLYEGIKTSLIEYGLKRDSVLKKMKTEESKKKRIAWKIKRKLDSKKRSEWSKQHGNDTYGKIRPKGRPCKCGSTEHSKITHSDCPLNRKNGYLDHYESDSQEGPEIQIPDGSPQGSDSEQDSDSDYEGFLDVDDLDYMVSEEKDICTCPNPKAHKRSCIMSIRNRTKRNALKTGDTVFIHIPRKKTQHLICRIAQINGALYTVHCNPGTLKQRFAFDELQRADIISDISLENWRQSKVVNIKDMPEKEWVNCNCRIGLPCYHEVDCDEEIQGHDKDHISFQIRTSLYTLSRSDIISVDGLNWINDAVVTASQKILAQQFPLIQGLQPPTLQLVKGFQVHRSQFVQIINVNDCHWCTVSTVGCNSGHVKVYDSLYQTVQKSTIPVIASLVNCTADTLKISMADVERQTNGSDCGVISIAFAYDLCAGHNPSTITYNPDKIREHLKGCLQDCSMTRFPIIGHRRPTMESELVCTEEIPIYCSCRMPEDTELYAECVSCNKWFHKSCANIPEKVFTDENMDWLCCCCSKNN